MPIINGNLDSSQQKVVVNAGPFPTVTGTDHALVVLPRPMRLSDAKQYSSGLSGTPTVTLKLIRFIAGAGSTTISISGALTATAFGTSGLQTFSLPAAGSSLLDLQKGDAIVATAGGSNAALAVCQVDLVLQTLQDYQTFYG